MDINGFKGYFETEYNGISPQGVYLHIYAKKAFVTAKVKAIKEFASKLPIYQNTVLKGGGFSVIVSLKYTDRAETEKYILSLLEELDANVISIGKIVIDDSDIHEDEKIAQEAFLKAVAAAFAESIPDRDSMIGLDKLDLNYTAHVKEFYGECFTFSVCFEGGAGEAELQAVTDRIENYEFNLEDDDYRGYLDYMLDNGKVLVNLDLGGIAPQNENKIIHGILLALNGIKDISQVVINDF